MIHTVKTKIVMHVFTVLLLTLAQQNVLQSQPVVRYRQCNTSESDSYHAHQMVQMNDKGDVLIYPAKRAFIRLSIPSRTATILETPLSLQQFDFMYSAPIDHGVFGVVRSFEWRGFTWTSDSGIVERQLPASSDGVVASVNGPSAIQSNGMFSVDAGRSWKLGKQLIRSASPAVINEVLPVQVKGGNPNRWYLLYRNRPDTLFPAWSSLKNNVSIARLYSTDSLICLGNAKLLVAAVGDTNYRVLDSLLVGGVYRKLLPRYIETLADSSILYCDYSGWYGTIRNMHIDTAHSILLGSIGYYLWQTPGYAYWVEPLTDSVTVYKVTLSAPPHIDQFRLPAEFQFAEPVSTKSPQTFGTYGLSIRWGDSRDYIIDLHERKPAILMYGSILAPVADYLSQRRMIASWLDDAHALHVLDDLGNAIVVDSNKVGYLTHPLVMFDQNDNAYTSIVKSPPSGRGWREKGTPLPVRWGASLVVPGPVLRRFSVDGRLLDTLKKVPVTFASVIDDSVLVTGSKNVLRYLDGHRYDTTAIASISDIDADSIGYPSSVVRARDGSLILTMLGTSIIPTDSVEAQQRRWGGILRSTDDGTSWHTVAIPSTGSYLMHCMRTSSGTLTASSMLMVEDTAHVVNVNAPESFYIASSTEMMRSTDNGITWSVTATPFYRGPYQPCTGNIIEVAPGTLYAATLAGVLMSVDDGRTWSSYDLLPQQALPSSVSLSTAGVLVATTLGVYEIPTVTSVYEAQTVTSCQPIATTRNAFYRLLQRNHVDECVVSDNAGRIYTIHALEDVPSAAGVYSVIDPSSPLLPAAVLLCKD